MPSAFIAFITLNFFKIISINAGLPHPTPHISPSEKSRSSTGKSPTVTEAGLTNPPYLAWQVKYLLPPTEPSFLPEGSSYSTPTYHPGWKRTSPEYLTVPLLWSCPGTATSHLAPSTIPPSTAFFFASLSSFCLAPYHF
jgi:hypothetical protein